MTMVQENTDVGVVAEIDDYIASPGFVSLIKACEEACYVFVKNTALEYVYCSEQFLSLANISAEDMIGCTDFSLPWKDMADIFRANDVNVMKSGVEAETKKRIMVEGDELTFKIIKVPIINYCGRVIGIVGTFHDMREKELCYEQAYKDAKTELEVPLMINNALFQYASHMLTSCQSDEDGADPIKVMETCNNLVSNVLGNVDLLDKKTIPLAYTINQTLQDLIGDNNVVLDADYNIYAKPYHYFIILMMVCHLMESIPAQEGIIIHLKPNHTVVRINKESEITQNHFSNTRYLTNQCSDTANALLDTYGISCRYEIVNSELVGFSYCLKKPMGDNTIEPFLKGLTMPGRLLLCLLAHPSLTTAEIEKITHSDLCKLLFDLPGSMHHYIHTYYDESSNQRVFKHKKPVSYLYDQLQRAYERVGGVYKGRDEFINFCQYVEE